MKKLPFNRRFVVLALVLLPASVSRGGDWPQFRGPNGSGASVATGLPIQWSKDKNIRWKAPLVGQGHSNPVIAGGKVFVTASSGFQESRLHVLCLDQVSGKQLWEFQTGAGMHAPVSMFEHRGKQYVLAFSAGSALIGSARGDSIWLFSLKGTMQEGDSGSTK